MAINFRRSALVRVLAAAAVAAAALAPTPSGAQESDAEQQREEVQARRAEIELDLDALQAKDAEVRAALADLEENVAGRKADLASARRALAGAEERLARARADLADVEERIVVLEEAADQLVVDSFVDPPADHALEVFRSDSLSDAAVKQVLLELQADNDADVLAELDRTREELEAQRREKERTAAEAKEAEDRAEARLDDVEAALAQQREFAADLERRLDARLAEAQALKRQDEELSAEIQAEQEELARQLRAISAASDDQAAATTDTGATTIEPAPGGLATVTCPAGGSITVAGSIAGDVQALLDASYADGVSLCGGGYRDPEQQIQLRMEHCGTSYYAIYEMPSSQCDPPTARPGSSQHELGLAIDFTCDGGGTVSYGTSCWDWLSGYANDYGLYNLPSEPWHWSTTGS